jgi:hypothetical protein
MNGDRQGSLYVRLLVFTILNGLIFWPWRWLRVAYDAGDHHPQLVLGMVILTLWTWTQLVSAIIRLFKDTTRSSRSEGQRRG